MYFRLKIISITKEKIARKEPIKSSLDYVKFIGILDFACTYIHDNPLLKEELSPSTYSNRIKVEEDRHNKNFYIIGYCQFELKLFDKAIHSFGEFIKIQNKKIAVESDPKELSLLNKKKVEAVNLSVISNILKPKQNFELAHQDFERITKSKVSDFRIYNTWAVLFDIEGKFKKAEEKYKNTFDLLNSELELFEKELKKVFNMDHEMDYKYFYKYEKIFFRNWYRLYLNKKQFKNAKTITEKAISYFDKKIIVLDETIKNVNSKINIITSAPETGYYYLIPEAEKSFPGIRYVSMQLLKMLSSEENLFKIKEATDILIAQDSIIQNTIWIGSTQVDIFNKDEFIWLDKKQKKPMKRKALSTFSKILTDRMKIREYYERLNKGKRELIYYRVYMFYKLKKYKEASNAYAKILKYSGDYNFCINIARLFWKLDKVGLAEKWLKTAKLKDRNQFESFHNLGVVYLSEAKRMVNKILSSPIDIKNSKQCDKRINELKDALNKLEYAVTNFTTAKEIYNKIKEPTQYKNKKIVRLYKNSSLTINEIIKIKNKLIKFYENAIKLYEKNIKNSNATLDLHKESVKILESLSYLNALHSENTEHNKSKEDINQVLSSVQLVITSWKNLIKKNRKCINDIEEDIMKKRKAIETDEISSEKLLGTKKAS